MSDEEKRANLFPLPRCPRCGNDMAPKFASDILTSYNRVIGFKCVKCDYYGG